MYPISDKERVGQSRGQPVMEVEEERQYLAQELNSYFRSEWEWMLSQYNTFKVNIDECSIIPNAY